MGFAAGEAASLPRPLPLPPAEVLPQPLPIDLNRKRLLCFCGVAAIEKALYSLFLRLVRVRVGLTLRASPARTLKSAAPARAEVHWMMG